MDVEPKSNIKYDEKRKKDKRKQRDKKVSDGQPVSKHGDKSHKNRCNDE